MTATDGASRDKRARIETPNHATPGGGSRGPLLALPRAGETAGANTMRRVSVPDRPTVLVVDDNADFREIVTDALSREGCRVAQVASTAEALRLLRALTPDLIVVDDGQRTATGKELVDALDEDLELDEIPVFTACAADILDLHRAPPSPAPLHLALDTRARRVMAPCSRRPLP